MISNSALYLMDKLENNIYYNSIYLLDNIGLDRGNFNSIAKDLVKFESDNDLQILYNIIERNNVDLNTLIYLLNTEFSGFMYSENSLISINTDLSYEREKDYDDLDMLF